MDLVAQESNLLIELNFISQRREWVVQKAHVAYKIVYSPQQMCVFSPNNTFSEL